MSELDVALQEELFRVYKRLPYISKEDFLTDYPKKLAEKKKFEEIKDTALEIGKLIAEKVNGKKCVYEMTKELRSQDFSVTPDTIYKILEEFRKMGGIRVQMLKPPEAVLEQKVHTTKPQFEPQEAEVPEAAERPSQLPETPSKTAEQAEISEVEEGLEEMLKQIEKGPSETKLTEASRRGAPVLKALLDMNSEIEVAAIVTPDGYSVSFASKEEVKLDELSVAASSAVIQSVSDKNLGYLQKGATEQIMLYTEKGVIFILPIETDYLLTLTASQEAQVGTIIRDATWARKRAKSELREQKRKKQ